MKKQTTKKVELSQKSINAIARAVAKELNKPQKVFINPENLKIKSSPLLKYLS
jgi:hypothetical protein